MFSFEFAQITWAFVIMISARAMVKLQGANLRFYKFFSKYSLVYRNSVKFTTEINETS